MYCQREAFNEDLPKISLQRHLQGVWDIIVVHIQYMGSVIFLTDILLVVCCGSKIYFGKQIQSLS